MADNAEKRNVEAVAETRAELKRLDREIARVSDEVKKMLERKEGLVRRKQDLMQKLNEDLSSELSNADWENGDFPWTLALYQKLGDVFGIEEFRSKQLSAINATMKGHDVILIMPTGGGKSLCYQLPALVSEGVTLVVSPLVSLMEDQIMSLEKRGIQASLLSANCSKEQVKAVHQAMTDSATQLKMIYVTPERLAKSKIFMTKLQKMFANKRFARLAIDEVHCCSQWGHDFRPDYKFLGIFRAMFPGVPILGLTATATSRVISEVRKILNLDECIMFKASFNRPNLFYEVLVKPDTAKECLDQLTQLLSQRFRNQSGIIYTTSTKDCDTLAKELSERKLKVAPYHANLEANHRSKVHTKWLANQYQAVVATIAFGMGIDKADVRFVIHHSISKSMENFYQESGRAGRDNEKAYCIVFWRLADVFRLSPMVFTEQTGTTNLYSVAAYCLDTHRCRREILAGYFGEVWQPANCSGMCDHCSRSGGGASRQLDIGPYLRAITKLIRHASQQQARLTAQKLIEAWTGKGAANLRLPAEELARPEQRLTCETVIAHLLIEGYLREDFHFTPYSTISYIVAAERSLVVGEQTTILISVADPGGDAQGAVQVDAQPAKRAAVKRKAKVVEISSDSE